MTSDEARGRVLDYAYGEMSPDEAARFEALLASDPALQAEVEAVRAVREAASGLAAVPLPVDVRVRLLREAERYARKRAKTVPVFWSFLERFLLSPAFTGAMVVVVALGVGVHLLLETGTEDRLSRIERAERAAVSEPGPAEALFAPAGDQDRAGLVAPVGGSETDERTEERRGRVVAETTARGDNSAAQALAEPARERTRKKAAEKVVMGPPPAPPRTIAVTDRVEATGEEAGAGVAVTGRLSTEALGKASGGRSSASGLSGQGATRLPAARPQAAAEGPPRAEESEANAARQAATDERDQDRDEGLAHLARARHLKSRGDLDSALTAYRKALRAGTLAGTDLRDALAEAAEVAIALQRPEAARAFLERLKALPGGPARAAPLERALERTDSE